MPARSPKIQPPPILRDFCSAVRRPIAHFTSTCHSGAPRCQAEPICGSTAGSILGGSRGSTSSIRANIARINQPAPGSSPPALSYRTPPAPFWARNSFNGCSMGLFDGLDRSPATWNVLAQQVLMAPVDRVVGRTWWWTWTSRRDMNSSGDACDDTSARQAASCTRLRVTRLIRGLFRSANDTVVGEISSSAARSRMESGGVILSAQTNTGESVSIPYTFKQK